MDTAIAEYQNLPDWPEPECLETSFLLEERAQFLLEIVRFLGSLALIMMTGLLLFLAG